MEEKKLGMFNIYSLGVGGTIGSGIFVMLGLGIMFTGRSAFLAVAVGCIYMVMAWLYQPIMASMFVLPGGDYDMKAMLCNPLFTGVGGLIAYITSLSLAVYGIAIVQYAANIFPGILPYTKPIAIAIITFFFAITIKGSKFASDVTSVMTVVLLIAIGLFIVFGLPKLQSDFFAKDTFFLNGGTGFIQAIAIMAFACQGTTLGPVSMMAVTKKPKRTIPLAIIPITLTVGLIYSLMAVVAAGVLPVEQVAGQNLGMVAEAIFPHWLYVVFILGGAVFAIATSLISLITVQRYPCLQVAEDGWLPKIFTRKLKNGYPYVVMGFYYVIAVVPVLLGFSLETVASMGMIPMMLMNLYTNLSLIRLVKQYPEQWKKSIFHMPYPAFCVLCVVGAGCAAAVAYNLFMTFSHFEMICCLILVGAMLAISAVRLKTGAVSKEALQKKREEITRRALEMEEE